MKLDIEKTAMIRARAGISFALTEALDEGHCGLPRDDLLPLAVELLEISDTIVLDALRLELDAGQVTADQVEGRDCVFLGGLYHAERSIADRPRILLRGSLSPGNRSIPRRPSRGWNHALAWRLPTARRRRSTPHCTRK
jgi:exodeoxyribonuclease V alpha subunit